MDILSYDKYILAFSGGKDSTACVLHILDIGVPADRIELWHHEIDGREGSDLMDWPCTASYCRAFAEALNLPIYFSWKVGGFECEMLRENERTRPTKFETPSGEVIQVGGTSGKESTRRKFPQVSADLKVRWCSAYLKIDVCSAAIRNQSRFDNSRTLVITGERAQESAARAKYNQFEPDRADSRDGRKGRHIDRWRPILNWPEEQVWAIIEKYKVRAHPAYYLGWGRVSCAACIFGSANQWASLWEINPEQVERISEYEEDFGHTIKRHKRIIDLVVEGTPYPGMEQEHIEDALAKEYTKPIFMELWQLPSGAYGESCGPT